MKRSGLRQFIYCVVLAVAAGGQMAIAQSGANDGTPIALEQNTGSDEAIRQRIIAIFNELDGLRSVDVAVKSGVVTLSGIVGEGRLAHRADSLASRVDGVVAVTDNIQEETSVGERLVPVYERLQSRGLQAASYIPLLFVAAALWLVIATIGFSLARRQWPFSRLAPNAFIADFLRQLVRICFVIIGGVLALDILGATALLGTFLGAAGIVGLAVGFAVRDTVENYIASILLSVRQPFRPEDFVRIDAYEGFVISLTARATILIDIDGNHIRIPNATVFKSTIVNYTTNPQRRFTFEVGIAAESNLERALSLGLETLRAQPFMLDEPAADAWIEDLGDSNVVLTFVGWVDQHETNLLKARSEALRLVKRALENDGIALPEPIYRVIFDGDTPASGDPTAIRQRPAEGRKEAESAQANDTAVDREFRRRVSEERDAKGSGDLLDESAPNEFGDRR